MLNPSELLASFCALILLLPPSQASPRVTCAHTSLWKMSVTFTLEKLGGLISALWCVLAKREGEREVVAEVRQGFAQVNKELLVGRSEP